MLVCRHTHVTLCLRVNPKNKMSEEKLHLPVKPCSSSQRAQPSSRSVAEVAVVSVGQFTVRSVFLQRLEPVYMERSHGGLFQPSLQILCETLACYKCRETLRCTMTSSSTQRAVFSTWKIAQ